MASVTDLSLEGSRGPPEPPPGPQDGTAGRRFSLRRGIPRFVATRLMWAVVSLVALSVLIFLATHVLPGDAARAALGQNATPERLALVREELGLNQPLWRQYTSWVGGLMTGDLGSSLANGMPVSSLVKDRIVYSLTLIGIATVASVPLAVFLGAQAATRSGRRFDRATNVSVLVLAAIPEFVVGVLLVVLFATAVFTLLPATSIIHSGESLVLQWRAFALPGAALALVSIPYITRMTRTAMIEALGSEYAEYAAINGIGPRSIAYRHCLPNAWPSIVQAIALTLGYLAGSSVVVEPVFNFPGIGLALVQAVNQRDFPVIQAISLFIGAFYAIVLLLADLASSLTVPRIRTTL